MLKSSSKWFRNSRRHTFGILLTFAAIFLVFEVPYFVFFVLLLDGFGGYTNFYNIQADSFPFFLIYWSMYKFLFHTAPLVLIFGITVVDSIRKLIVLRKKQSIIHTKAQIVAFVILGLWFLLLYRNDYSFWKTFTEEFRYPNAVNINYSAPQYKKGKIKFDTTDLETKVWAYYRNRLPAGYSMDEPSPDAYGGNAAFITDGDEDFYVTINKNEKSGFLHVSILQ